MNNIPERFLKKIQKAKKKQLKELDLSSGGGIADNQKLTTIPVEIFALEQAEKQRLILEVVDWRKVVPDAGRPQQVIFDQLKPTTWDIFIGILWHRFGSPTGAANPATQKEYLSGTYEEFMTAYRLWEKFKQPRIMMYRCTRSIPPNALDPDQFKRVNEFFAQFDGSKGEHPALYQTFDTVENFEKLLWEHLQRVLLEYDETE